MILLKSQVKYLLTESLLWVELCDFNGHVTLGRVGLMGAFLSNFLAHSEQVTVPNCLLLFHHAHLVHKVSIPFLYRVLTVYNVLIPANGTVFAFHSQGLHCATSGHLLLETSTYRSHTVCQLCAVSCHRLADVYTHPAPSHTVYKSRVLFYLSNFVSGSGQYLKHSKFN